MQHLFIIGAQRSGTTYLYNVLDAHPEIEMIKPVRPEPKFFLDEEEYGKDSAHYLSKYNTSGNHKILGEKSTSYIEFDFVADRIKNLFPEATIIAILRNPVQRAISNYFFTKNHGLETRTLEEVFIDGAPNPDYPKHLSVNPFDYLARGKYINYLKSFNDCKVIINEAFTGNSSAIQNLYKSLDVDDSFIPKNITSKVNTSKADSEVSAQVIDFLKNYYKPYNKQLAQYLNTDLSVWE